MGISQTRGRKWTYKNLTKHPIISMQNDIILKLSKANNKEIILKAARKKKKKIVIYKGNPTGLSSDFSAETLGQETGIF